jgi:FixJ family two-component response regulator
MAVVAPIVFVVDDDISVRESLELLIAIPGGRSLALRRSFSPGHDHCRRAACTLV